MWYLLAAISANCWIFAATPVLAATLLHTERLRRDALRATRLIWAVALIYLFTAFVVFALETLDSTSGRYWALLVFPISAYLSASRFCRWSDLPAKALESVDAVIRLEAHW